ncbi:MAG: nuclear transport factor 2 family protein [Bacteroidota bacterium]|nr:nuclear transport factor 2 family protein [Bacteroidota bacterium]
MKTIALVISLFLVNASLAQNTEQRKKQIQLVIDRQVAGWNSGNIDSFMTGYVQFDSLRFASGGSVTYGWKNMLERYKKNYPSKEKMGVLTFSQISIDLISSDAAMVFGKWSLKRSNDEPWGLFTLLFRNTSGEWRIVHDHTSSGN